MISAIGSNCQRNVIDFINERWWLTIDKKIEQCDKMNTFLMEIKLSVNHRLFEKGYITEEMYVRAKEYIIKQAA